MFQRTSLLCSIMIRLRKEQVIIERETKKSVTSRPKSGVTDDIGCTTSDRDGKQTRTSFSGATAKPLCFHFAKENVTKTRHVSAGILLNASIYQKGCCNKGKTCVCAFISRRKTKAMLKQKTKKESNSIANTLRYA